MKFHNVYLGLGSNIGEMERNLFIALSRLIAHPSVEIRQISPTYLTQPLYYVDQENFLNLVTEISTDLSPVQLLKVTQSIENLMGRKRNGIPKGPRIIDIDIVFFSDVVYESISLQIPHPRLYERKFVLKPLSDIAGNFTCPATKLSVTELLAQCRDESWIKPYRSDLIHEEFVLHSH